VTVDLSNCDREPIHQLGHIQPFGAMVVVNADWIVAHHSTNFDAKLGAGKQIGPGVRLADVFAAKAVETLRRSLSGRFDADQVERIFGLDLTGEGGLFDVAVHSMGALTIIEFEPHDRQGFDSHVSALRPIMGHLDGQRTQKELCAEAARRLKHILGFDRVMVYRFHDDLSGEVYAEARETHLESFHGLRYPSTDIPAQARALYLRNRFRIISDVHADPVPIVPAQSLEGEPLDLSLSTLRAVSPIHIEYLRNMGVDASLSISIVIRGKLWGLFACHHYSPRVLPFSVRSVAELFSQMFSLLLARIIGEEEQALAEQGQQMHDRLMTRLATGDSLRENLATIGSAIGSIIPHHGASAYIEGQYEAHGAAPAEEEFLALLPQLNASPTSHVLASEALAETVPAAAAFADRAAGALIIPVSRRPRDYYVLWRKELSQVVTWAGNPEKPVEHGPEGDRLTPRKSFAQWQQTVRGQSEQWTPAERRIANSLRVTLLEVVLKLTDEAVQDRQRAHEQQELLIAELNHRVRNILNLTRSLISQSSREATDIAAFSQIIGGRIGALATAHDHITRENWTPASLKELIASEARAYLTGNEDRVRVEGDDAHVQPEAYTVLALVLHEMMTNSVKYGSLCDRRGTLTITLETRPGGDLSLRWRERGGPPVKPPSRRGFGSTIIERSIPHDLKGEAEVRYKLAGLEADFLVPARFIAARAPDVQAAAAPDKAPRASARAMLPQRILIVEDSMIIALDAEDTLKEIGIAHVNLAASVAGAFDSLDRDRPDLVILDFNLGNESSEPVAERLRADGIPFLFATGYGEVTQGLGEVAVLKKPYGRDDLETALIKAMEQTTGQGGEAPGS